MSKKTPSASRKSTKTPKQGGVKQLNQRLQDNSPIAELNSEASYDSDATVIETGEDHDDDDNAARLESYQTHGVGLTPQVAIRSDFVPATVQAKPKANVSMGPPSAPRGRPRKRKQSIINVFTDTNESPPTILKQKAPKAPVRKRKRSPELDVSNQASQRQPSPPRPDVESLEDDSDFERDWTAVIKYRDAVVPQYRAAAAARATKSLLARLPCRESDLRRVVPKGSTYRTAQLPTRPEFWQDLWLADLAAKSNFDPVTTEICWTLSRLRSKGRNFLLGNDHVATGAQIPIPVLRPVVAPILSKGTPTGRVARYLDLTDRKVMQMHTGKTLWAVDRSGTFQQRTPWSIAPGLNDQLRLLDTDTSDGAQRLNWHTWHLLDPTTAPDPHAPMTHHTRLLAQTVHTSHIFRQRRRVQRLNAKFVAQWCAWGYELRRKVRGMLVEVHGTNEERGQIHDADLQKPGQDVRPGVLVDQSSVAVKAGREIAGLGRIGGGGDYGLGPMELTILKRHGDGEGEMGTDVVPKYERVGLGYGSERLPDLRLKEMLEREMNWVLWWTGLRDQGKGRIGEVGLKLESGKLKDTRDKVVVIEDEEADEDDEADDDQSGFSHDSDDASDSEGPDEEVEDDGTIEAGAGVDGATEDEQDHDRDTSVTDIGRRSDDQQQDVLTAGPVPQHTRRPSLEEHVDVMQALAEQVEQRWRASSV